MRKEKQKKSIQSHFFITDNFSPDFSKISENPTHKITNLKLTKSCKLLK